MNFKQLLEIKEKYKSQGKDGVLSMEICDLISVAEQYFHLRNEVWRLTEGREDHSDELPERLLELSCNQNRFN